MDGPSAPFRSEYHRPGLRRGRRGTTWTSAVVLVLGVVLIAVGSYLTLVGGGILAFTQTVFVGLGLALLLLGFGADFYGERKVYHRSRKGA